MLVQIEKEIKIMSSKEIKEITKIRETYAQKETTKFDELKALDKKMKTPALIFAYVFGIVGSLVLGTGMCLAMKIIGNAMALGIVIGLIGILMVSVNYFIYKRILSSRRKKYQEKVLSLTDELLK